ncbi:MAG: hypothetical protein WAP07_07155 [Acutalibacteraceae bacterium]
MNDIYDNTWDELAKAIIKQAVDDWRTLIRVEKRVLLMPGRKISLMEIRRFFRSDYCQSLMGGDPLIILKQLEKELKRSREEGSLI